VRRASAISVLAAICFSLIAPLALADPKSTLPACCRRNGAHHCSMPEDDGAPSSGFQAVFEKCPLFPLSTAAPPCGSAAAVESSTATFALPLSRSFLARETESRPHHFFHDARQKRGPPDLLVNS